MGIDLAGSAKRSTGFCRLDSTGWAETTCLHEDPEVIAAVREACPSIVGVDAPLSLPLGRVSLEIPGPPHFRAADLQLRERGVPFFPLTLGPMRVLTARGMRLANDLRKLGYPVWEVYPGGAQDLLGLPRKRAGIGPLTRALAQLGVRGAFTEAAVTHDELDAVSAALVCHLHRAGRSELYGDAREGQILMPLRGARPTWSGPGGFRRP